MALVAIFGNLSAFNIQIYDMAGGGYYIILCDGITPVFQRRNSASNTDTQIKYSGVAAWVLDRFTAYSWDAVNKTLTLTGAVDVVNGVTFTRSESYKFVSDYVVENSWNVSASNPAAQINFTNWNYYAGSVNKVIDIDNGNFGDGVSTLPLGFAVQLAPGGPAYGCIADNPYSSKNCNRKRALASQHGIACTWVNPGDAFLTIAAPYTLKQWFFKSAATTTDMTLQGQLAIAAAKGYSGTTWEKIARVTAYLNIALNADLTTVLLVPSPYYAVGMWMRDSFWQSFLVDNAIEQGAITRFETYQQSSGQMPTVVYSDNTLFLAKDESNILYIIRAYYDRIIRGLTINQTVLQKAFDYMQTKVTNGEYRTDTSGGQYQGWLDSYAFNNGIIFDYNQGLYCVALQAAKALGLAVTEAMIVAAGAKYTSLYDNSNNFVHFTSDTTLMSTSAFFGEALSLWLFGRAFFSDTQVKNHIDRIRLLASTPYGLKCVSNYTDGSYLPGAAFWDSPYAGGDYQNGGSWLLFEHFLYLAGKYHNYPNAQQLIDARFAMELLVDPLSHEYLNTNPASGIYGTEPSTRHVYSWNTATIIIKKDDIVAIPGGFASFGTKKMEVF